MGSKVGELLGKGMDSMHRLEANQPMISFLLGIYDNLRQHFRQFGQDNPELAHSSIPHAQEAAECKKLLLVRALCT
jgi:hypothetical protein